MFQLNLKIALRNLWKNKISSLINVIGLAIGLTACLLLLIYVSYEWNFDKQAKNSENVYTAMTNIKDDQEKVFMTFEGTTTAFSPFLKEQVPEVKYIARLNYGTKGLIANGTSSFKKQVVFADPDLLKIYDYQFITGEANTALNNPNSVVLTETMARNLFGSTDVLNKTVRYQDQWNLLVTGVIKDLAANSSSQFDYLIPWSFYETISPEAKDVNWTNYSFKTLVTLNQGTNIALINQKIGVILGAHVDTKLRGTQFLFPLSQLHLYGKFEQGRSIGGAIEKIWLFMGLAFGILLIACINFMNMATAKSEKRAKEVGIKKTIGATRTSLILQFLTESLVLTLISVILAIALIEVFLPSFNQLLGIQMTIPYEQGYALFSIFGIVLITGIIAGSYPAFYLSSFNPIQTLKRKTKGSGFLSVSLRQVLIVTQFCFTIVLIMATLVIYKQIQYVKNKPVGIDVNALVEMPQDGALKTRYKELEAQLLKSGAVTNMYYSYSGLSHHNNNFSDLRWPGLQGDNTILFNKMLTTSGFVKTTGLKLVAGRDFSEKLASDTAAVLVSMSAVKTMGLKNPVGQVLKLFNDKITIIGVFEDYVWDSPYKSNNPMIVSYSKHSTNVVTMRLNTERGLQENVETIERITKQLNPAYPTEVKFISTIYGDLFKQEKILGILSNLFGGLAILISCLGLFGLVAYSAEQRTKEFGIRKVLGASIYSLMELLSLSFIKMIMVAIVIAVPIAYYAMGIWLQQFEFHTSISWWIILVAGSGTLLLAFLTVSFQAYKVATANPVDALKYE